MQYWHPDVQIKNYKTFTGHEGEPLAQGSLYFRGKKIAEWSDDAHGGPFRVQGYDGKTFVPHAKLEAHFRDFADVARQMLTGKKDLLDRPYDMEAMPDSDVVEEYIQCLTLEYPTLMRVQRAIKDGAKIATLDASGDIYTYPMPYTAENVARLRVKYPGIVKVFNEILGQSYLSPEATDTAQEAARLKSLAAKCKKHAVFDVMEGGARVTKMSTAPYSKTLIAQLRAKYGTNFVECYNERLGVGLA